MRLLLLLCFAATTGFWACASGHASATADASSTTAGEPSTPVVRNTLPGETGQVLTIPSNPVTTPLPISDQGSDTPPEDVVAVSAGDGTVMIRTWLPAERFTLGQPVMARITIVNESPDPITIVLTNDVQLLQPRILEVVPEGPVRPVPMTRYGRALRESERFRRFAKILESGAAHEASLDLAHVFDLSIPGPYALETAITYSQGRRQVTLSGPRAPFVVGGDREP